MKLPLHYVGYLGRKVVAKGDDLQQVLVECKSAVTDTGKNPWKKRFCQSVVVWDNLELVVIALVTDDSNGVAIHNVKGADKVHLP